MLLKKLMKKMMFREKKKIKNAAETQQSQDSRREIY